MLLTARNVPLYLAERGLLSYEAIVDGEVVVSDASRRNRNFKVRRGTQPGFFVKQAAHFDPLSTETVRRDARCYWLAANHPEFAALRPLLPAFHDFDVARTALVASLVDAETVYQLHLRLGTFPIEVAVALAKTLAHYHVAFRGLPSSEAGRTFPRTLPWVLVMGDPVAFPVAQQTPAGRELLQLARTLHVERMLSARRTAWQAETLIHGDLKWDNCLVTSTEAGREIRLVDWEIADIGDVAWDVGSILQTYLAHCLFTTAPASAAMDGERIRPAQPVLRAFWTAYVAAARVADPASLLDRSVAFAAGRLAQTAYESLFMSPSITASAADMVNVASRILAAGPHAYRIVFGA